MIRTKDAAKFLGISESALRGWRCSGIGPPFYTISVRRILYDEAELQKWRSERRCVPVPHTTGHYAALSK